MEKLLKLFKKYNEVFPDGFPSFMFIDEDPDRIEEIILDCIEKKKNVYELGYLKEANENMNY